MIASPNFNETFEEMIRTANVKSQGVNVFLGHSKKIVLDLGRCPGSTSLVALLKEGIKVIGSSD